ncbi:MULTISPECIES: TetR/AcrR family transcriptional regulator [Calothrix]|uniref:TetR/AcrR family transcriptional regulator n=2 Tax=Calothrix TaxID=1186 RepID=A0ABR8AAG2_9CYAN|nr:MULTISPECIES: TetR/AcrR family transcriptional regulator [Calothrix]MBD2195757.1 TetR/AcrR family transcriptional regulator [Calothrix parietina FACHB-288]MBD2224413.1 TetR/AcrR family transcriptional regulator [Calothrix anomala FACHB-343]
MGRPVKEKSLTQQDVINAAIACLDQEGEAALGVNRVARELGIKPPAIYKHLDGNLALRRAVALTIWQQYIEWSRQQTNGLEDPQALLRAGGRATRDFARSYPNRYRVMTQFQLNLQDPETSPLIQEVFRFLKRVLQSYNLSETKLIDAMRMVNAAITGFIAIEQAGLMTLERSTDASYEVMIDALVVAIQHIQKVDS